MQNKKLQNKIYSSFTKIKDRFSSQSKFFFYNCCIFCLFRISANPSGLFHFKRALLMYNVNIFHINNTHTCFLAVKPLCIELKVIVQRDAIGDPHLPRAYKLNSVCFVSSRIADILHRAQSLLSWMPGELELDTASCIMVHRRTPRLLTQSASWIRCYRLPCVLFDLSNKP